MRPRDLFASKKTLTLNFRVDDVETFKQMLAEMFVKEGTPSSSRTGIGAIFSSRLVGDFKGSIDHRHFLARPLLPINPIFPATSYGDIKGDFAMVGQKESKTIELVLTAQLKPNERLKAVGSKIPMILFAVLLVWLSKSLFVGIFLGVFILVAIVYSLLYVTWEMKRDLDAIEQNLRKHFHMLMVENPSSF